MTSEVRVVVTGLANSCRAVKITDPGKTPVIIIDNLIRTGDAATREAAWKLFLDELGGPEEMRK